MADLLTTDIDTVRAAGTSSVIEPAVALGPMPLYTIHHYKNGQAEGRSIARGDEIHDWIATLHNAGRTVALGWQLRGQDAPDGWRELEEARQ